MHDDDDTDIQETQLPRIDVTSDASVSAAVDQAYLQAGWTHAAVLQLSRSDRKSVLGDGASSAAQTGSCWGSARLTAGVATPGVLTYGEVGTADVLRVLAGVAPRAGEQFVDLGCGRGQVVLAAHLRWGHRFRRCLGVDLLEGLVRSGAAIARDLQPHLPPATATSGGECELTWHVGDFLEEWQQWVDFDVVWITGTMFPEEWMHRTGPLGSRLATLKPGARVVTVTKKLDIPGLRCVRRAGGAKCSWGDDTIYVFERHDDHDL